MIATCRHCQTMILGPDTGMIVNGSPSREYMRFIEKLVRHVKATHPEQQACTAAVLELAGHLAGLSILANFATADPELKKYRDGVAALLHRVAGRTVPDEALRHRVLEAGFLDCDSEDGAVTLPPRPAQAAFELLRDLRDALTYADVPVSLIVKPVDTAPV